MKISCDLQGVIELEVDDTDVRPPTDLLRQFVASSGDRDLSDGIQTGEFEQQMRLALSRGA